MFQRMLLRVLALPAFCLVALPGCDSQTGAIKQAPEQHQEYVGGHGGVGGAAGPDAPGATKPAQ